jgi:predicted solute-binding protein
MLRYSILCLLAIAGCLQVDAQNPVFTTEVSANKMGIKDRIQVTYTLRDNVMDVVEMGPTGMNDFAVVEGPYQSGPNHSLSIINGKRTESISISLTYIVQPKRLGLLTIPPAIAKSKDGRTIQSNGAQVEVIQGSLMAQRRQAATSDPLEEQWKQMMAMQQQMQAIQAQRYRQQMQQMQQARQQQAANIPTNTDISKDLFIKVTVDKNKVHVGEQITASYKLYARVAMQVGISKLPSLNGFWTQDFDIPKNIRPVEETYNGKKYQVFLLKKSALFPQQTGTLELDAAEAEGTARIIQTVKQRNPLADFFDDPAVQQAMGGSLMMNDPFFNGSMLDAYAYKDIPVKIKSAPVKIQVEAVPEAGKPSNYGGAVGNFNISAKIDKCTFTTDDVVNLRITIAGSGNLKLIEPPLLNLPNGLSHYDPISLDTVTGRSTTITGSKIITYPIAARNPGEYSIPAITFSYYNPQTGAYVIENTEPIKLHIKAGKNYNPAALAKNGGLKDIHNINTTPLTSLNFGGKPMLLSVGYWSMYALPLLAFVGIAFWRRREDELSSDVIAYKSRKANKIALKRLSAAQKLLTQNSRVPFYEEVSKAIWLYLSDKLNIPLSSLSKESAEQALSTRNIPQDLQLRMERVISDCETALYAPMGSSQQMNNTYQEAVGIISRLEETFNS